MKFKLLASVLVLAVALTGVLGATAAYFSDTEQSTTTVAAGTLDLTIGNGGATIPATINNMAPGMSKEVLVVKLKNNGTIDGKLSFVNMVAQDFENTVTEPEVGDDSTNDIGELSGKLRYSIKFYKSLLSVFDANDVDFNFMQEADIVSRLDFSLRDLGTEWLRSQIINLPNLRANEYCYAVIDVSWPTSDNDNIAQGDSAIINAIFSLDQLQ